MFGGLGGGLISGGLGAISSIFSNKAQAEENQRNRDFTEYMYDKQYDNNIKMWNMQNKYDLPSAQKQRLIDAGLNPDLMYSGAGVSPSPNLHAAVAGSPSSGSLPGYGGAVEAFNQGRLLDAQIRNIDADTKQKESQTVGQGYQNEILKSDASFRDALNSGQIDVQGFTIKNLSKDLETKDVNIAYVRKSIEQIQKNMDSLAQNIEESKARIRNLDVDTISKQLDNALKAAGMEYDLRILAATAHCSEAQAKYAISKAIKELAVLDSTARANNASASVNEVNCKIGTFEFNYKKENGVYVAEFDAQKSESRSREASANRKYEVDSVRDRSTGGALGKISRAIDFATDITSRVVPFIGK
nr:MAG TPA: DNA pilot protein VP2 [Microviridae sp.]